MTPTSRDLYLLRSGHGWSSRRQTSLSAPTRFTHSAEDAASLFSGLRVFYWGIAIALGVAARFQRGLVVPAIAFALLLIVWQRRIRRAPKTEWFLEIGDDAIVVGDRSVARDDASYVCFRRETIRYAQWTQLQVVAPSGETIFREGIADGHVEPMLAALEEHGWTVE